MEFQVPNPVYGIAPLLTVGAAFVVPLLSLFIRSKRFYDLYALAVLAFDVFASSAILFSIASTGNIVVYPFGGWTPPVGIAYEIDLFNAFLGFITAAIAFVIALYASWYTDSVRGYEWFYTLFLGLVGGMLGCIYTGDAFNLFVMIEVLSISAYALVAFYRSKAEAVEAAMKYGIIGAAATTMYFLALIVIYASYGTLNMAEISIRAAEPEAHLPFSDVFGSIALATGIALALSLWPFTYKSALMPNHFWLPDAHPEAPTPVSAALSGLVVNVGIYASARFLYTLFGGDSVPDILRVRDVVMYALIILGALSAIVAALMMALQRDVKRLLAYSTVSHVGLMYMALGLGVSTTSRDAAVLALVALQLHILNHALGKAMLFLSTGVLIKAAGSRDLDRLAGLGRIYRVAGLATLVGALQLLGVPPFSGFFSKLYMYQAFLDAGLPILAAVVVISSAISVMGYGKLILMAVGGQRSAQITSTKSMRSDAALLILVIGIILTSIALPIGLADLLNRSASMLYNPAAYREAFKQFVDSYIRALLTSAGGG